MKVKCISKKGGNLTVGVIYEAKENQDDYRILDEGYEGWYYKELFEPVEEKENKTMKGYEAIKYLCENPKARFSNEIEQELVIVNDTIKLASGGGFYYPLISHLQRDDWQLIQKSVTFQEAFEALKKGKIIRHEFNHDYNNRDCFTTTLTYDKNSSAITIDRLLYGKWFIE